MSAHPNRNAHIAIITANILFGLNYSYSKSIMPEFLTPGALALLRMLFCSVMFLALLPIIRRERVSWGDIGKLAVASLLGLMLNQVLFLQGLRYTSPVDASIITTCIPLMVLIISSLFLNEKITVTKLAGVVVGGVGALSLILYGGISSPGEGMMAGNIMILAASAFYAGYLVWVKPLTQKYSPITIMVYIFTISTILTLPLFGGELARTDFGAIPPGVWGAIAFVVMGSAFTGFLCMAYGLRSVKPTTASIYQYSQPVVASTLAIFRGQDSLNGIKLISAALVFIGVFIVTRSSRSGHGAVK